VPIPDLPTPDDLLTRLMVWFFGPGTAAASLFVLCLGLNAWREWIRKGFKYGRKAGEFGNLALSVRPVAFGFALISCTLMLVIQALWLWTCYVAGNAWSYLIHPPKRIPETGPQWDRIFATLHWDSMSKIYLSICFLALILSYSAVVLGREINFGIAIGVILLAPTALFAVFALVVGLLGLLLSTMYLISDGYFVLRPSTKGVLLLLGFSVAHIITTSIAIYTPKMMSDVWRRNARPAVASPA
jgi:hypothetical protein